MDKSNKTDHSNKISWVNISLALLPFFSFFLQYVYSIEAGTEQILFHHSTVMIVDWIFIPFNFWVVSTINWKQGGKIYLMVMISVILNIITHAFWQYNKVDPGHMITNSGIFLPAGWVHLAFSTLETILLFAFVFCRKSGASKIKLVTIFASIYFLAMGISGYIIQHKIALSDVIVAVSGLFFVLIYPRWHERKASENN